MHKQSNIIRLLWLHLCNTFHINEMRFGHDAKKTKRSVWMLVLYAFLLLIFVVYVYHSSVLFADAGHSEIIPLFTCVIASAAVIILTIFTAGHTIFDPKSFEREIVLPVRPYEIALSRIITIYLMNFVITLILFIPAVIVYQGFNPFSFPLFLAGSLITPLLPISVSILLGTLGSAIAARLPHKNAVSSAVSVIFCLALFLLIFSQNGDGGALMKLTDVFASMSDMFSQYYPPAAWFASGDPLLVGCFAAVSAGVFAIITALTVWKFSAICSAMNVKYAKHHYSMQKLSSVPQTKSLFKREVKRYFSSSVYVSNTIMGNIIAIVFGVAVLIFGSDALNNLFGGNGFVFSAVPFVIAILVSMSTTTAPSISIEGKQWWLLQTLPVPAKKIIHAKLSLHFILAVPCALLSALLLSIALQPDLPGVLALFVVPVSYIVFTGILGLYNGLKYPEFTWDAEIKAVKQGPALVYTLVLSLVSAGVPLIASLFAGPVITACVVVPVVLILAFVLYRKCCRVELVNIG